MMYINGHWENVDTLQDIARVIREYYNPELANEMEEQVQEMVDHLNNEIEQLHEEIYALKYYDYDYDDICCDD